MTALQIIKVQEELAEILMRDFGLSYNQAMIEVLDSQNKSDESGYMRAVLPHKRSFQG